MSTKPPPPKAPAANGTKAPPPPKPLSLPSAPARTMANPVRAPKNFTVGTYTGKGEGEKTIIFGGSGMGKTTLSSMAPSPVFIPLDDGGRKIRHPITGEPIHAIHGIEDFQDVRDVLARHELFEPFKTAVIDTGTKLEEFAERHVVANCTTEKGKRVTSIEGFGWGKGYRHLMEAMRLIMMDLDVLVRKGKNVVILCQENAAIMPNAEGLDYLQAGPKLHHAKSGDPSIRFAYQEWADHVFRVGYLETNVVGEEDATRGKIASTDTTRCVYTSAARHFFAKTRSNGENTLPPVISFANPQDDSLWQWLARQEA